MDVSHTRKKVIVVYSHPRSGTHLTLDFIRINFPDFAPRLWPWQGDGLLYIDIDAAALSSSHMRYGVKHFRNRSVVLAKTHLLHEEKVSSNLKDMFPDHELVFIYPFRKFSNTIVSYYNFLGETRSIVEFFESKDPFFHSDRTVGEMAQYHAIKGISIANLLNVDDLFSDTNKTLSILEDIFCTKRLGNIIPVKKYNDDKSQILKRRLSGRQSTEVLIQRKTTHENTDLDLIDTKLDTTYQELCKLAINR